MLLLVLIFTIKVGVEAIVGALTGLVGEAMAQFILIEIGALCVADIKAYIILLSKSIRILA